MKSGNSLAAAALGLLVATSAGAQQTDWNAVQIKPVKVTDNLYLLMGQGGNIGLSIGDDGAFIVDDQFAPLSARIKEAIRRITEKPVRFVVNTHWHGDHTGGNENFGNDGALIVAHDNVRRRMDPALLKDVVGWTQAAPRAALPVITFGRDATFHWNGETIHAIHVPASHTDGDAVIHFVGADAIHMGDTFFNGRFPFIDVQSGGTINGMIASSNAVLAIARPSTRILPGHGDIAGIRELTAYRDMLVTVRDRVTAMRDRGLNEAAVVAAKPTADLDAAWGPNPERFVQAVFQTLTPK